MLILSLSRNLVAATIARVGFGVILIAAMAQIVIPAYPVHISLQTVACILIGLLYNPRTAFATWISYLILGAAGMPVFINFSYGLSKFTGPTAGYLLGMLLASCTIAFIRTNFPVNLKKISHIFTLIILGQIIIYTLGVSWLSHLIGFEKAIYSGFLFFIPSGIVKSILLSVIFRSVYVKTA